MAVRQLSDLPEEQADEAMARPIERLKVAKAEFKGSHSDPDGYGSATFGELETDLLALAAHRAGEHSIDAPLI